MIKLLISLVILMVAANAAITGCKHKSHEVFFPSPHNEHIIIDDMPKEINLHSNRKKLPDRINTDTLDDEIRKILPDILKEKHHKGGKTIRQNDPVLHISVEYDDKSKIDIDDNDRVKPIHKIIKKDLPDLINKKFDLNSNDKNKNKWRDDRDYINKDQIIRDDTDILKKEISDWDNKGVEYDKWSNKKINDGFDLIFPNKKDFNIYVPQIVYDRSGDKNVLVELNDNVNDYILNTTKGAIDNLHSLETDLLNVNLNFNPLFPLKNKANPDGSITFDPIAVKRNNDVNSKLGWNNRNLENIWSKSDEFKNWLKKQQQIRLDNENRRGVIKDRIVKVHEDEFETDWSDNRNDNKRWNIDLRAPELKYSSSDGDNADDVDDTDGGDGN